MKRLATLVIALIAALLAWSISTAQVEAAPGEPPTPIHTYNDTDRLARSTLATTERGPPATYDRQNTYDAGGRWSYGIAARPRVATSGSITSYHDRVTLLPVASEATMTEATMTEATVGSSEGTLVSLARVGVAANGADDAVAITTRYSRPSGATTRAQRESIQGQPCVDCGNIAERQVADHIDPLVVEYYRTGTIDLARMRSLDAVQPQCPASRRRLMDQQVEIPVETLRRAADLLLSHLEAIEGPVIALDKDMFWAIPVEQRNNVYTKPTDFTVGQLTESLQSVDRIVEGSSPATSYALVWLVDILRAAGEAVVD